MVNPCCGTSLRSGTRTVAILQIVSLCNGLTKYCFEATFNISQVWNVLAILILFGLASFGLATKLLEHAYGSECTSDNGWNETSDTNSTPSEQFNSVNRGDATSEGDYEGQDPFCDPAFG